MTLYISQWQLYQLLNPSLVNPDISSLENSVDPNQLASDEGIRTGSTLLSTLLLNGHQREKSGLRGFANNKGADQPAHPRSLISAFVIRCLESIICKLATREVLTF